MTKSEVVAIFESIADILQIKGEELGKVQMYRKIARILDYNLQEDLQTLYEQKELINIPGIGISTVEKIEELLTTGKCQYYEGLKASIPPGVLDLMSISGVGPSTAARFYQELHIESLEDLKQALDEQKLRNLKGMGKKTEEKIKTGLEAVMRYKELRLMGYVLPVAQSITEYVTAVVPSCNRISITSDLRRKTETVKEVQLLASCQNSAQLCKALSKSEFVEEVESDWTDKGGSAKIAGDVRLRVIITESDHFGVASICHTGSEAHLSGLNNRARQLGLAPLELNSPPDWSKGKPEEEIYDVLNLPYIPPELREGTGEIEATASGQLPELISMDDIRGDLHVHSTWSDGNETIEAMAEASRNFGYEYIAVCDHSVSSKIANGLDVERILNKMIEVREINERISGIEILMGAEVDILKDGSLDYPDQILEKLDVVTASIHSGFSMDEATTTKRIISAIENRFVHIIGHPTGRLIARREPYSVNIDAIIDAAAENKKSLELNSYPDRLDLKDTHLRKAKERNVIITINTDAHSVADLNLMVYGIYTARRGWLEKKDVLNTFPLIEVMKWLNKTKI